MLQILTIIKTLFQLFPLIIEGIKTIEAAFPHAQQGAAKLDMLKGMVQNAYTVGTGTEAAFETVAPAIDTIAKTAVGVFNATGAFKSSVQAVVSGPDNSDPVTTIG